MAICYQVSARGRLMCITGGRTLTPGELTPTPAQALQAMLAGQVMAIHEKDVIPLHRLWWQAVTAEIEMKRRGGSNDGAATASGWPQPRCDHGVAVGAGLEPHQAELLEAGTAAA